MSLRSFARVTRSAFALAAVVILASCQHDLLQQIDHSWALATVNGAPLPYTVPNSTPTIVIASGHSEIDGNGNYVFTFTGTSDDVQGTVGSDAGTWSIHNSTFLFNSSTVGIDSYIAALGSGTFNLALPGQIVHSSDQAVNMIFNQIQ